VTDTHPSWPTTGVVATLHQVADGRFRLTLEDVASVMTLDAITWKREGLFTYREFDTPSLRELKLTQQQLAEIGENLLIRLIATRGSLLPDGSYRASSTIHA
jgi:hypothetical protein